MRVLSSLSFPLLSVLFFLSLHQGLANESGCRLTLSKNNQSLAVRMGSAGELTCQISSECDLTQRIMGPFWLRADRNWFVPNVRMYNMVINSTTISLRYSKITLRDLGIYHCIARIGRKKLSVTANITECQVKQGDVIVTPGPDPTDRPPLKKRFADPFVGLGLVKAVPPRRRVGRSLQNQAKDPLHGNPPVPKGEFPSRGLANESGCRLTLSKNNQSLAVRMGSAGELTCQISSECDLTNRIMGPFWLRADRNWFVPNVRMYNMVINSTTISLRYSKIIRKDLGIYHCIARIGRKKLSVTANITEYQVKPGDVTVTPGPDPTDRPPLKKRFADPFVGLGLVKAVPPRRLVGRSLQNQAKDPLHGNPPTPKGEFPSRGKPGLRPLKTPCDEEKLFSKTGIIIVAALVCSTFLLLYMVILLMAVPRVCFPYYPKKKPTIRQDDDGTADSGQIKGGSTTKVNIPLTQKVRHNGRSDSGIESVDGLEEKGLHHGGGRGGSHWDIGADKLEEFYRRTTHQNAGSDEDMLSGLKIYNMEKNIPRRGRSESVPVTPYRYQSSIYVKI